MIYIFAMFGYLFVQSIRFELNKKTNKDPFLYIIIIFVLAFSYNNGSDWVHYQIFYENVIPYIELSDILSGEQRFEIGYVLLNFLFYKFLNYELFMGLILSVCIFLLIKFLTFYSHNRYIAIIIFMTLYLFISSIEPVIRQMISLTIIVYGFKFIERNLFFKYLLVILIAGQFHQSAYLLLILYFIKGIRLKLEHVIFLLFCFFLLLKNIDYVLFGLSNVMPFLTKYIIYLSVDEYGTEKSRTILGNLFLYSQLAVYYIIILKSKTTKLIKNMAYFFIVISILVIYFPIISRINNYFIFALAVSISYIGTLIRIPKLRIVLISILLVINLLVFFREIQRTEYSAFKYLEYHNYFIEIMKGNVFENSSDKIEDYQGSLGLKQR